jgi:hypothetical protein
MLAAAPFRMGVNASQRPAEAALRTDSLRTRKVTRVLTMRAARGRLDAGGAHVQQRRPVGQARLQGAALARQVLQTKVVN